MDLPQPEGYCELLVAYESPKETKLNVIGVIVDYMPAVETKTGDWMLTVKLFDSSLRDSLYGNVGYTLRFFASKLDWVPQVHGIGDVLLARGVRSMPYNGQPMALSSRYETRWLLFVREQIPDPAYVLSLSKSSLRSEKRPDQIPYEPTTLEQQYIIHLKKSLSTEVDDLLASSSVQKRVPNPANIPTGPRADTKKKLSNLGAKYKTIKHLKTHTFADLCVMVVRKFHHDPGRRTELYVTDYTENDRLFYYTPPEKQDEHEREGDKFGYSDNPKRQWKGPYGHLVLKVNTRDPHSTYANLWGEEDKLLVLRNVKIKAMNEFSNLEGDMWPDDQNPGKNNVRRLQPDEHDWEEVQKLLDRKAQYERYRSNLERKHARAARGPNEANHHDHDAKRAKKSKSGAKIESSTDKKKDKQKTQAAKRPPNVDERGGTIAETGRSTRGTASSGTFSEVDGNARSTDSLWQVNKHIRANFPQVQCTSVLDILDHRNRYHLMKDEQGRNMTIPFANIRTRSLVRVVDFSPTLDKFATPALKDPDLHYSSFPEEVEKPGYEWRFRLQLEDASLGADIKQVKDSDGKPVRFVVEVFHKEAQFLLGNNTPDPVDLATNPALLAKLREKMCILWGNLEEWKSSNWTLKGGLKNKPFVCCVAEYGVHAEEGGPSASLGMKKCFKLTDTTIMLG